MSGEQLITPSYTSKAEELLYKIGGTEAAIQAAIRTNDDQEWLEYLQNRRTELKRQLDLCQQPMTNDKNK